MLVPSLVMMIPFINYDKLKALIGALNKETPLIGVFSEYCVLRHFVVRFTWRVASGWWGVGAGGGDRSARSARTSRTRAASTPGIQPSIHYLSQYLIDSHLINYLQLSVYLGRKGIWNIDCVYTFSLIMFRDNMQRLLNFCSPAAVPTEWNVQLWTWIDLDIF